jgi:hypothetical protein
MLGAFDVRILPKVVRPCLVIAGGLFIIAETRQARKRDQMESPEDAPGEKAHSLASEDAVVFVREQEGTSGRQLGTGHCDGEGGGVGGRREGRGDKGRGEVRRYQMNAGVVRNAIELGKEGRPISKQRHHMTLTSAGLVTLENARGTISSGKCPRERSRSREADGGEDGKEDGGKRRKHGRA